MTNDEKYFLFLLSSPAKAPRDMETSFPFEFYSFERVGVKKKEHSSNKCEKLEAVIVDSYLMRSAP